MGTQTVSKNRRTKAAKSALAVALALLLALGGTLAYLTHTVAVNTIKTTSNPGARLHDDFTWTADNKNKDVYVENFGSRYVLARVQLKEYLEKGPGAGTESFAGTPVTNPAGLVKDNPETWQPYDFNSPSADVHDHFKLDFGGSTVYMPTFNKNMDSNDPDVNGSYDDAGGPYSKYKSYSVGDELTAEEKLTGNVSGGNVKHTAKKTLDSKVISMTDWKDPSKYNSQSGPYWVYDAPDANGEVWAYWAQPIAPDSATGLLLDNVRLASAQDGDWYYQIAAIGDFVTPEELNKVDAADGNPAAYYLNQGSEGGADKKPISKDAYDLLDQAKGEAAAVEALSALEPGSTATANLDLDNDNTAETPVYLLDKKEFAKSQLGANGCQREGTYGLVMVKNVILGATQFNSTNSQPGWSGSSAQTWCNDTYLNGTITGSIKNLIPEVTLKTSHDGTPVNPAITQDRVFFLSETDMFGSLAGSAYINTSLCTNGEGPLITSENESILGAGTWYWLRSAFNTELVASIIGEESSGGHINTNNSSSTGAARPAFWVYLGA